MRFRLRRPLGILTGTIDKLLITPSANGEGFDVEIIDFKTNRFRSPSKPSAQQPHTRRCDRRGAGFEAGRNAPS